MGFWSKLGKIGTFAAPLVAAPFTGGTSLALLGAGSGAAGAALDKKGWKGILGGAGMGAIPGLGKAGQVAGAGSKLSKASKILGPAASILGGKGGGGTYQTPPFVGTTGINGPMGQEGKQQNILQRILGASPDLSTVLGKAAGSAQEANRFRDTSSIAAEGAKLARDKFAAAAPQQRLGNSVKASMLLNAKPQTVSWGGPGSGLNGQIPTFSGGPADALGNLDPQTKELAQSILKNELVAQLKGGDSEMPYMKDFGKTSLSDKLLGGAALGTSIAGAFGAGQGGGAYDRIRQLIDPTYDPTTAFGGDQGPMPGPGQEAYDKIAGAYSPSARGEFNPDDYLPPEWDEEGIG